MEKKLSVVGTDRAKQIFHLVGVDTAGQIVWKKRLERTQLMRVIAQ